MYRRTEAKKGSENEEYSRVVVYRHNIKINIQHTSLVLITVVVVVVVVVVLKKLSDLPVFDFHMDCFVVQRQPERDILCIGVLREVISQQYQ